MVSRQGPGPSSMMFRQPGASVREAARVQFAPMAREPVVRCASCFRPLPEPPNIPIEDRVPCLNCGGMNRNYEVTLTATALVQPDLVQPGMAQPETPAEAASVAGSLAEIAFRVDWWQLSPGGAWMIRVFDDQGKWIDGSIQDDPQDAILAVSERLLPPPDA